MDITTTKKLSQLSHYEQGELKELLVRRYGLTRGIQIWELANRIDGQRKHISAWSAVDRAVEWYRRRRIEA